MCTVSENISAWPNSRWVASSATTCICNTTTAISMCRQITLTRFVNTSVAKHQLLIEWVAQILLAQSRVCEAPFAKSPKNLSCFTKNESTQRATRSRPTRRGKTKWKRHFRLLKHPINARQLLKPRPTWSAKFRWIVLSAVMSVSARQRSRFVRHLNAFKMANKLRFLCRQLCSHRSMARHLPTDLPAIRFKLKFCRAS